MLDSTVLVDVLRGAAEAARRLRGMRAAGDTPYVCAVNVEEVARGLRDDRQREAAERLIDGLWLVPLGEREGWLAGRWRQAYAAQGVTLTQGDCLIAAAAATVGGRLATGNPKHFPMPELQVEHWPAGA